MQLLLFNKADPWSTDKINYKELVKDKPNAAKILTKSRKVILNMKIDFQKNSYECNPKILNLNFLF